MPPTDTAPPSPETAPPELPFHRQHPVITYGVGGFFVTLIAFLYILAMGREQDLTDQKATSQNGRNVHALLAQYARDHQGLYPDTDPSARYANGAFHLLFTQGTAVPADEASFGAPRSPHAPDGKIGTAPDFAQALQPGENHWALVGAMGQRDAPNQILLMEDPAQATWPPTWNTDVKGKRAAARSWADRTILIIINDGSAQLHHLNDGPGLQPIAPDPIGRTPFNQKPANLPANAKPPRILDIAE